MYYSGFESEIARNLLSEDLRHELNTIVLYEDEKLWFKSAAVFKIISKMRFPWPVLKVFSVLPTAFTDLVYDWIARHRIAWFGRSEQCFIPDPEQRSRFFE